MALWKGMNWNGETFTTARPTRNLFNNRGRVNRILTDAEGMRGGPKVRDIPDISKRKC